jgi:hypothetical protein
LLLFVRRVLIRSRSVATIFCQDRRSRLTILNELATAGALQPIYVRGQAYLAAKRGGEAASEFQKILDHRGIVRNEVLGALAQLGLARAYVL